MSLDELNISIGDIKRNSGPAAEYVKRVMCDFANPESYAIVDTGFKAYFGDRLHMLSETPEYAVAQTYRTIAEVPLHMRQYFPQGHPFWKDFRSEAQLTGSVSAALAGFHDAKAGAKLRVPKSMWVHGGTNGQWDDFLDRARTPGMPSTNLDPPGNFNAAGGKYKEAGVVGTLLEAVPTMHFREVGAIVIDAHHLMHFNLMDLMTNQRIVDLPYRLVISPDGDLTLPLDPSNPDGPTIEAAAEIKAPTYFGVKNSSPFFGLDFYPKGSGCAPYPHPKEYYLPQVFLEMLALKRRHNLFVSYTLSMGAVAWIVEMDERYLSLLLTVFNFLYRTFASLNKPVPTDYFLNLSQRSPIRILYEELLELTVQTCDSAAEYLRISAAECFAFGEKMGFRSKETFVKFPAIPRDVLPEYHLLLVYAHRLFKLPENFHWVRQWKDIENRLSNVAYAIDTPLTLFLNKMLTPVVFGGTVAARYPENARDHPKVQNRVVETAEEAVAEALHVIHTLYGAPQFGVPLDPLVFHDNCAPYLFRGREWYEEQAEAFKPYAGLYDIRHDSLFDGLSDAVDGGSTSPPSMAEYARVVAGFTLQALYQKRSKRECA